LIDEGLSPIAVLSQPDRPAGRGRKLQASPVKQTALDHGIDVHQPESLRNEAAVDLISRLHADLMIVVAYGLILPAEILSLPRHGCWNIHASLLPRWRGAAPIQRAIEAGDAESGVCIMQMDTGLDTGAVLKKERIRLDSDETGGSLHDKLADLGATALLDCVKRLASGESLVPEEQADSGATYAHKLDKAEARIDWSEPADVLERKIRAFNPWPVTWCLINGERTRVWSSEVVDTAHGRRPGTVIASGRQGIDIATGEKALRLRELQRPGKRRMCAADYLNAVTLPDRLDSET
jgi:methionyl-tRNA formyltransferase